MARAAALGERTFLRRFRAATGQNPRDYLQQLRVEQARALIEQSTLTMDEIAGRLGYEDTGAFRRVFRRITGLAPLAYRRRFRPASIGKTVQGEKQDCSSGRNPGTSFD